MKDHAVKINKQEYRLVKEEIQRIQKNTKKIVLGIVLFAVVIAVLFGCWKVFGAKTTQGAKSYTLTVQDDKGDKKVYEGHTDAEYVRGALEELERRKILP